MGYDGKGQYPITKIEEIDTLKIDFSKNYILEKLPVTILNPGNNWIKGFTILRDTISDETNAHLGILH